jgi:transposase InsO family protein
VNGSIDLSVDDVSRHILLALSDNGPQMTSGSTREFLALCAIAAHFGRPGCPAAQAWIESLVGRVKAEWPQLEKIRDLSALSAELERIREHYNDVRLHAGFPQQFRITEGPSGGNSRVVTTPQAPQVGEVGLDSGIVAASNGPKAAA